MSDGIDGSTSLLWSLRLTNGLNYRSVVVKCCPSHSRYAYACGNLGKRGVVPGIIEEHRLRSRGGEKNLDITYVDFVPVTIKCIMLTL